MFGCNNCDKRIVLRDVIEEKFASEEFQQRAQALAQKAQSVIDNENRERILVGHAFAIALDGRLRLSQEQARQY